MAPAWMEPEALDRKLVVRTDSRAKDIVQLQNLLGCSCPISGRAVPCRSGRPIHSVDPTVRVLVLVGLACAKHLRVRYRPSFKGSSCSALPAREVSLSSPPTPTAPTMLQPSSLWLLSGGLWAYPALTVTGPLSPAPSAAKPAPASTSCCT